MDQTTLKVKDGITSLGHKQTVVCLWIDSSLTRASEGFPRSRGQRQCSLPEEWVPRRPYAPSAEIRALSMVTVDRLLPASTPGIHSGWASVHRLWYRVNSIKRVYIRFSFDQERASKANFPVIITSSHCGQVLQHLDQECTYHLPAAKEHLVQKSRLELG